MDLDLHDSAVTAIGKLRTALQADGADLQVREVSSSSAQIELIVTDKACLDCIVNKQILQGILLDALVITLPSIREVTVIDPREADGSRH